MTLRGIWAAVLTPVDQQYEPDAARAVPYYRRLLENGCDGLNLLGTTGEAPSFSLRQRLDFMQAIAQSDLPLERVMVGTGAASLADAAALTSAAFELGFSAALVMPPFYFRDLTDDAVMRYFESLFARTNPPGARVVLYNFPRMSGVKFGVELVGRLVGAYPLVVSGLKESSNDRVLQGKLIERFPDLAILPGSESSLPQTRAMGCAGCISGSVALWPGPAAAAWKSDREGAARISQWREALERRPLISAVRYLVSRARSDEEWLRSPPPLGLPDRANLDELCATLDRLGYRPDEL